MFTADATIAGFLPYSCHVADDVVKTRGGEYLLAWSLGGLPFLGRDDWEIEHRHATFNRLLQALRAPDVANVAFWSHDIRRRRRLRLHYRFGQAFNQMVSDGYHAALADARVLQNELYLTLVHRPSAPPRALDDNGDRAYLANREQQGIARVHELAANAEAVLRDYAPRRLATYRAESGVVFSEALEFFGWLLNGIDEPVPVLPAPVHRYLAVSRHQFSARTGDFAVTAPDGRVRYGALLNIKEFSDTTWPGILNGLKYLEGEYVVTHSFSPMARVDALRVLDRTKGMMISSGDRAVSQMLELDQAMDQLASGGFVLGEYHFTMAVHADDQATLAADLTRARAELANAGFVTTKEDVAVAPAFYAQLPANWRYRTRIANLSSLNFLGLAPLHNFAGGKAHGNPWGDSVTVLQAANGQPYHFNFHATHPSEQAFGEKAIGNTMVVGKSGTGKTALVNFLLSQLQRLQPRPTIVFFDKDQGAEIFVRACGGRYFAIASGQPTGFNPLQCAPSQDNVQFLMDWIRMLAGLADFSPRDEEDVHRAVLAVLDSPAPLRTVTNLRRSLPNHGDQGLHARLRRWTAGQSLGWVFDNPVDRVDLDGAAIIGFDYTALLDNDEVRAPVIRYLLHRLESLIDGRRLVYVMDEFWKILDGGGALKDFARNKQKTIRKQNGLGIFATQSPEDALASDIAAALVEQTATLVLLPNPGASRRDYVEGLKLTDAEFRIVAGLDERSRSFLVKQGHASTVCRLDLQGMDDILAVLSAGTASVARMHAVRRRVADARGCDPDLLAPDDWLPGFLDAMREDRRGTGSAVPEPHTPQGATT